MDIEQRVTKLEKTMKEHFHAGYDSSSLIPRFFDYFAGSINSDGTAVFLPPGWASAKSATGQYTITHKLGSRDFGLVATPLYSSDSRMTAIILSKSTTTFVVNTLLDSVSAINDTDNPFFFIVFTYNPSGSF